MTLKVARQGHFFVEGSYQPSKGRTVSGSMAVFYQIPETEGGRKLPLVIIHGAWQTGVNFLETPDGREGWASFFLRRGYPVYVVDQIGRGRSAYAPSLDDFVRSRPSVDIVCDYFTAPSKAMLYPQAAQHSQWVGNGQPGDPVFEHFYASQTDGIADRTLNEALGRSAGINLVDKIGECILLCHSQAGPIGWGIANDRPEAVKAVVAIEPSGPPFFDIDFPAGEHGFKESQLVRPYGLTALPLEYAPSVQSSSELAHDLHPSADPQRYAACRLQVGPPRQLSRFTMPILLLTSECSYHSVYDHGTSNYLSQAGVDHDFIRLEELGILGNGHFMMLEQNCEGVAGVVADWLDAQTPESRA
ncbi:alpha/beta hydrolase [Neorhizobium galegae]|uniref:alpha/beta hydrolase n=1 Tax=Neorhizobium galegae TaxID=399 RepID=UPI002107E8CF|nr:alpha/beta hydrolase [Neorhizobium galegae]MCQ1766949.1 alpha/beta hydrolase [Neorhizobium galegae]MCQ1849084.1 alpha/beta hydrolase [Neorhizobium galegae]